MYEIPVELPFNGYRVDGKLTLPVRAKSLIIFSHGYGRSSLMPHEHRLALAFRQAGYGTLALDTLDIHDEFSTDAEGFKFLSRGLLAATNWLHSHSEYRKLDLAYCGSGRGAAPALQAASELDNVIKTVICISGAIDLKKVDIPEVHTPVLLIAGELDFNIVGSNRKVLKRLGGPKQLAVIPGASHMFEEPDKLNEAAHIAISWYQKYLRSGKPRADMLEESAKK